MAVFLAKGRERSVPCARIGQGRGPSEVRAWRNIFKLAVCVTGNGCADTHTPHKATPSPHSITIARPRDASATTAKAHTMYTVWWF